MPPVMQLPTNSGGASHSSHSSDSPKSGSGGEPVSSDVDACTVVVDDSSSHHARQQHHAAGAFHKGSGLPTHSSAKSINNAGDLHHRSHHGAAAAPGATPAAAAAAASKDVEDGGSAAGVQQQQQHAAPAAAARPRTYYVDWLRAFLTVLVVVHHCVVAYQSSYAWAAKRGDTALFLFSELFVNGNQAYFMTLFFFLSGLYVPGSYRRKGAAKFLLDRTLRLVVPCIVYSFLGPPFILWWNALARNPGAPPGPLLAAQFRAWLTPTGWPTTYILPTGPPWFVWMLWCFNVAYVILKWAASCEWLALPILGCCGVRDTAPHASKARQQPHASGGGKAARGGGGGGAPSALAFSTPQMLWGAASLALAFFGTCFGARMLDHFVFGVRPFQFVQRGPFVSFMPDLFPTYAIAFVLGVYSGPGGLNMLARLPDGWASWGLWVGGCWWLWAGWLLNITLRPLMAGQRGVPAFVLSWALRTAVEQSFCVVWSLGLLVTFRRAFNARPGLVGRHFVAGAYGAYLVHPLVLIVFARVIMAYPFPSAVVNAAIISPPSVATSWLLAVLLRAIPGAHHIL